MKSKLFSTLGTVLEQRTTDSGDIVSYIIKTDRGHITIRHRKFMRELAPEHDPRVTNVNKLRFELGSTQAEAYRLQFYKKFKFS